jgi:hypothetical protein
MRKLVVVTCLALGVAAIPGGATASPIGPNLCGLTSAGVAQCDIFADYTGTGASTLGLAEGNLGSYLLGYTFLLNQAADLSDGFDASDVAHILVIHDSLFELFSNTVFNSAFDSVFTAASTAAPIDGLSPSIGQFAGCPPTPAGVPNLGGVGYCATGDLVTLFASWGTSSGDGGNDLLTIHTAFGPDETEPPPDPAPVPEPGTLSLLVIGGSGVVAALRRRRRTE